jgi:CheY-like chemotaxis protein
MVAVLDTTPEWPAVGGIDVKVLEPSDGIVGRIGEIGPGRCIVNLAARGAIAAAAELRTAGVAIPLWGAIVVDGGERGLSLGQIEVVTRPIDPDLVRSQCATIAPKNARILAIGSDSSTFIALRQGLMKAGMSVSIAWDLKQATELMEIVRPHMVVLDLALPGRGAASLVAELARLEATPVLVLLPGTPEQVAAFSGALPGFVPTEGARNQQNLLRAVIDAKRNANAAPAAAAG